MSNHVINRRKSLYNTSGPVAPFKGCTTKQTAFGWHAHYQGQLVAVFENGAWSVL